MFINVLIITILKFTIKVKVYSIYTRNTVFNTYDFT